ncbi:MAG: glycoside hydrolase family 127 protein [Candidatus Solibacter sp.]
MSNPTNPKNTEGAGDVTRRRFLASAAAVAVAAPLGRGAGAPPAAASPFPLGAVKLLSGPFLDAMEQNRAYLRRLELDRLLHTLRLNAGFASSAQPLGGWESPEIEIRGHFEGHYLSACALIGSSAGDREMKTRGEEMVSEMLRCQKKSGDGYLSAFPPELFDRLKNGKEVWVPWYTVHKILAGLVDMHRIAGSKDALAAAEGMAQWTKRWLDPIPDDQLQRILQTEFGGMADSLVDLYRITGNADYLAAARRFEHRRVMDPLAAGRDELRGLHVNTQIPKMIGAANAFEATGEARYRQIAEYSWNQVANHRAYCTGGTSNQERWRRGPDELATELSNTTHECCCTYNMLKLTRHLFSWSPQANYADYYERALFNGILGTISPEIGTTMYYIPMASGYWRVFARPNESFWCCTGSGVETFSKLADSIYFHDNAGVWVNLFVPSELDWAEKGLKLRQQTKVPDEGSATLEVTAAKPVECEMRLRVPSWATAGYRVKVNGKAVEGRAEPSSYFTVKRTWKTGDRVEIEMPMTVRAQATPDDPRVQAYLYGPSVLAADLGSEGLTAESYHGTPTEKVKNHFLRGEAVAVPELTPKGEPGSWIRREDGPRARFRMTGQPGNLTLAPFSRITKQRYAIYWRTT